PIRRLKRKLPVLLIMDTMTGYILVLVVIETDVTEEKARSQVYVQFLSRVINQIGRPKMMISDQEAALISAIETVSRKILIQLCLEHVWDLVEKKNFRQKRRRMKYLQSSSVNGNT